MKKIFVKYNDGSSTTYTLKNSDNPTEYIDRHINNVDLKSLILQQYPKKDNAPIVYK